METKRSNCEGGWNNTGINEGNLYQGVREVYRSADNFDVVLPVKSKIPLAILPFLQQGVQRIDCGQKALSFPDRCIFWCGIRTIPLGQECLCRICQILEKSRTGLRSVGDCSRYGNPFLSMGKEESVQYDQSMVLWRQVISQGSLNIIYNAYH